MNGWCSVFAREGPFAPKNGRGARGFGLRNVEPTPRAAPSCHHDWFPAGQASRRAVTAERREWPDRIRPAGGELHRAHSRRIGAARRHRHQLALRDGGALGGLQDAEIRHREGRALRGDRVAAGLGDAGRQCQVITFTRLSGPVGRQKAVRLLWPKP